MHSLEEKILAEGRVLPGHVLKVDGFLNHRLDVDFLCEAGKEFYRLFRDCGVTKILTIEASGIGVACLAAQYFHAPVVFAKKNRTSNIANDVYAVSVHSYTHNRDYNVVVSKEYLSPDDRVLLIDDFLANGCALDGLVELVNQAGATLVGAGIMIEKAFQGGGDRLRKKGIRVESLARIASMTDTGLEFVR